MCFEEDILILFLFTIKKRKEDKKDKDWFAICFQVRADLINLKLMKNYMYLIWMQVWTFASCSVSCPHAEKETKKDETTTWSWSRLITNERNTTNKSGWWWSARWWSRVASDDSGMSGWWQWLVTLLCCDLLLFYGSESTGEGGREEGVFVWCFLAEIVAKMGGVVVVTLNRD